MKTALEVTCWCADDLAALGGPAALEPCLDAPSRSTPLTGQYVNGDLSASIDSLNTRHFLARAFEDILTGGEGPH